MRNGIVQSDRPVTLVGAGDLRRARLREALRLAPVLVAADGGANVAAAMGLVPDAVIGDLDSIRADVRAALPPGRIVAVAEQDTTDFEKCLTRTEAPFRIAVGFTGARADHTLAVCNALVRHPGRVCLLLSETDVTFLAPPRIALPLPPGTRVSLFPMGAVQAVSAGLRWPVAGIGFAPDGPVGTSNEATGPVTLETSAARMLVILPRRWLRVAIAALAAGR
ncbi:MAG: thiamine diphosphokinase [Paracoccaceae bacterium]